MKQRHRLASRISGGFFRAIVPGLLMLCGASVLACTIPVFRFALDRWEADPFRLVIPSAWATQPEMIKLLVQLRGNAEANIKIEESTDPSLAEARLLFPHDDVSIWSGKLDAASIGALLDSPARKDLLKRVLEGDSVVWVVCTSSADKAEADRIEKRLRYLEQVATLPIQDPNDPDSQLGPGPPLKLKFSVLRLSLDDPAERHFAAMIAGPKQQDFISKGTSFAGPVFAKGRVLGSWPLSELDDTAIEDASLFLIGRCSCRIKNENPGWDVVLKTDWEFALAKANDSKTKPSETAQERAEVKAKEAAVPASAPLTSPGQAPAKSIDERVKELETYVANPKPPSVAPTSASGGGLVVYFQHSPLLLAIVAAAVLALVAGSLLLFRR